MRNHEEVKKNAKERINEMETMKFNLGSREHQQEMRESEERRGNARAQMAWMWCNFVGKGALTAH